MSASIPMSEPHRLLCLEVAWEIDAMARVLPDLVPVTDESNGVHFVVRALAGRLLRLSHVLIGTLDGDDLDELSQVIDLHSGQG